MTSFKHPFSQNYDEENAHFPAPMTRGEKHKRFILVVDDDPHLRMLNRLFLKGSDYKVLTAASGEHALKIFALCRKQISAVLTDVMMPVMDGFNLARKLLELSPALPIIASSGSDDIEMSIALKEAGVSTFLPKPYSPGKLLSVLDEILAKHCVNDLSSVDTVTIAKLFSRASHRSAFQQTLVAA